MQGTSGNSSNNNNSTRRRRAVTRNGVVVRSVWETRMKMDEVQGGIKVFNAGECDANAADEEGLRVYRRLRRNQSDGAAAAAAERKKRRSWSTSGSGPVTLRKSRSEVSNSQKVSASAAAAEKQVLLICDGKDEGEEEEKRESFDDKEMDKPLEKPKNSEEEEGGEEAEEEEEEEEKEINKIHEIPTSPKAKNNAELDSETIKTPQETIQIHQEPIMRSLSENKSDPMVACRDLNPEPVKSPQEKKLVAMNQRAINPEPSPEKKKPETVIIRRATKPAPTKSPPVEFYDNEVPESIGATHNKMQNIVDLVMWRDVSKSAFVFGLGTFSLISSSYAKDLNFCLISSISYLGLVYLALMFLYKSILRRGEGVECDEERYCMVVGEEEAIWVVRLLLPYINELLLKLRALFSGDPATTMKLALLLFALARCGSSVTVWTLAKLGFFGVFTLPKVCSSYSIQLARYGKFWLERFRDGWESCTHKKAVAAAAFTLIWNVSSTVARIWAVFMLVVAVKLYQQRIAAEWSSCGDEVAEEGAEDFRKVPSPIEVRRGTKIKRRL